MSTISQKDRSASGGTGNTPRHSIEIIVVAGFAVVLLLLGGIGFLSITNTLKMRRAVTWVDQAHDVMEVLKELELDLRESESMLQNYVLTGDRAQLEEFHRQADGELPLHLSRLRALTLDNPDQQQRLDRIEPLLTKRVQLMKETLLAFKEAPADSARRTRLNQIGTEQTAEVLVVFREFATHERHLLDSEITARETGAEFVTRAISASVILGLACTAASLIAILSGLRKRREIEARLVASLAEKQILLKEIHHRVKNNMHVAASLLALQSEKIHDPAAAAVFQECGERLQMMSRLHEELYSNDDFVWVKFADHLRKLTEMLVKSHTPLGCQLALQIDVQPIDVDLDTGVTLGLIANELILNALKHAFHDRQTASLTVSLRPGARNELSVTDDGAGLPDGFNVKKSSGLGLELVTGLTRQLHGEVTFANGPEKGVIAVVSFPSPATR